MRRDLAEQDAARRVASDDADDRQRARMPMRWISGCASAGADHDPEGDRQEREAGLQRAVAAGSPARRSRRSRTSRRARTMTSSIATLRAVSERQAEDPEPDQRRLRAQLDRRRTRASSATASAKRPSVLPDVQPYVLRLDDVVDEHEQPAGDGRRRRRRRRSPGRSSARVFGMKRSDEHERRDADRQVDEEDPAPRERLGEQAAERSGRPRRRRRRSRSRRRAPSCAPCPRRTSS